MVSGVEKRRLTDANVRSLVAASSRAGYSVTDIAGRLSVWVSQTGTKIFRYRYRLGSKSDTIPLGETHLLSVAQAWEKVRHYEAIRSEGRDPKLSIYRASTATTLADVLDIHLSELDHGESNRNATSNYKSIRAALGNLALIDVTPDKIREWIDANYADRLGAARLLLRNLTAAFNVALAPEQGKKLILPASYSNPAKGLKTKLKILKGTRPGSHAVSFDDDEWSAIHKGFEKAYADPSCGLVGMLALELIMLTGARPSEILTLQPHQIDQYKARDGDIIVSVGRIIKDKHKTWLKTARPRQILLGPNAVDVLARAAKYRELNGYEETWIFPTAGRRENPKYLHVVNDNYYMDRLSKYIGTRLKPYNFRSAYINHAIDAGVAIEVVSENVGHTDIATTLKYYQRNKDLKLIRGTLAADAAFGAAKEKA